MEVWSGTVAAGSLSLEGVRLIDPSSPSQCDISKAKLSLRSFVDPSLIPLLALVGPVLEVHISNPTTGAWVKTKLLRQLGPELTDDLDEEPPTAKQCPVGILLVVESHGPTSNPRRITDILIYGVLSPVDSITQQGGGTSSSPAMGLRIYAAPICASLVTKAQSLPTPPPTPSLNSNDSYSAGASEYVEFPFDPLAPSPKRKRVDTLFEAADQFHKKVRRKGVVAVSEFIGKRREESPMLQFPYLKVKREQQNDGSSASSVPLSREKQRAGSVAGKIPSLSRQASLISRARSKSVSSQKATLSTPIPANERSESHAGDSPGEDIITTNKALLTRTILTCMRLYGYHRNANTTRMRSEGNATGLPTTKNATTEPQPSDVDAEEEEEFKAMYHATYRASTFALRKFLNPKYPVAATSLGTSTKTGEATPSVPVLDRQRATDVVDSVLKLFCEEP